MNFYDKAHELVRSFKETNEYKEYMQKKHEIKNDENAYKMLKDFKEKQQIQQMEYINTGKMNEELNSQLENLYSIAIQNENIRKLLEMEMKLNVLLADLQKILADAVKEIVEF